MWTEKKGNMGASYLKQKAFFSLTTCATAVETTAACRSNAARPERTKTADREALLPMMARKTKSPSSMSQQVERS